MRKQTKAVNIWHVNIYLFPHLSIVPCISTGLGPSIQRFSFLPCTLNKLQLFCQNLGGILDLFRIIQNFNYFCFFKSLASRGNYHHKFLSFWGVLYCVLDCFLVKNMAIFLPLVHLRICVAVISSSIFFFFLVFK